MTEVQSIRRPSPAVAAVRFAVGGSVGCVALAAMAPRGGMLALYGPPLAFFASTFWAAGELRLGVLGRLGFGAAVAISTFSSSLALMATQGMTGRENFFVALTIPFLVVNSVSGLLGLLLVLPVRPKAFAYGVVGFVAGGTVAGLIAAVAMETHQLNFYTALPLVAIPGVVAGTASALALACSQPAGPKTAPLT